MLSINNKSNQRTQGLKRKASQALPIIRPAAQPIIEISQKLSRPELKKLNQGQSNLSYTSGRPDMGLIRGAETFEEDNFDKIKDLLKEDPTAFLDQLTSLNGRVLDTAPGIFKAIEKLVNEKSSDPFPDLEAELIKEVCENNDLDYDPDMEPEDLCEAFYNLMSDVLGDLKKEYRDLLEHVDKHNDDLIEELADKMKYDRDLSRRVLEAFERSWQVATEFLDADQALDKITNKRVKAVAAKLENALEDSYAESRSKLIYELMLLIYKNLDEIRENKHTYPLTVLKNIVRPLEAFMPEGQGIKILDISLGQYSSDAFMNFATTLHKMFKAWKEPIDESELALQ